MEKNHLFLNAGIHPLEPNPSLSIPMQMQPNNNDCFFFPTWEKSSDQCLHFDSASSNSNFISNEEIIAKLGDIGGGISPHYHQMSVVSYTTVSPGNADTNMTKLNLRHLMDQYNKEVVNFPDPGFVERAAARFSCSGSRSSNAELGYNLMGSSIKVSSSSALEVIGFGMGKRGCDGIEPENSSQEESTVSDHLSNGWKASCERNSRKRKAASGGKANDPLPNVFKDAEIKDNSCAKRRKPNQGSENENSSAKEEEDNSEPFKDYIRVRARRGQATDSHSLAERVRREKISERMKLLQDLVPGCNKVTGKALMLDEIINYVQSLQRQVEFLSMKLASVNPSLDFNVDTFTSKDIFQSNPQLPHPMFPLDSSASAIFYHQPLQNQLLHSDISNGIVTQCPVDQLGTELCHNPNLMLPQFDSFISTTPQHSTFFEDDLQTIVQMGFGRTPDQETTLQPQNYRGSNRYTKIEL